MPQHPNGKKKAVMRVSEKELEDFCENGSKDRAKMQPLPHEVSGEIDEHERAVANEAKNGRLEKQPYPSVW